MWLSVPIYAMDQSMINNEVDLTNTSSNRNGIPTINYSDLPSNNVNLPIHTRIFPHNTFLPENGGVLSNNTVLPFTDNTINRFRPIAPYPPAIPTSMNLPTANIPL
jgi:hypothetical protein